MRSHARPLSFEKNCIGPKTAFLDRHFAIKRPSSSYRASTNQPDILCSACGKLKSSRHIVCRGSNTSSTKTAEDEIGTSSRSKNGQTGNGKSGSNGKSEHTNGKSQIDAPSSELRNSNGSQNGNGNGKPHPTEQGLIERSESLQTSPGNASNGLSKENASGNGKERSMNRNSGPKRPRGTLSPYGDVETAEGSNGTSVRNGRKMKERGEKAKRQRGSLDIPENLRKVEATNSRMNVEDGGLGASDITPASSWLPYSPLKTQGVDAPLKQENFGNVFEFLRAKLCTIPDYISSQITSRLQQLMLSNTLVKLGAVFVFATPAVIIGGELYSLLTGTSPAEGFLKIYSVLYIIPGVNVLAENDIYSFILVNAIFLLGTFFFAVVLGVVSDDIGNEFKAIRSGNYPVVIKDHVLILNWNRQTPPLLRQLALAFKETDESEKQTQKMALNPRQRGIVVLAQHTKSWMDAEVQTALRGYNITWQTREGAPYSANDLSRVSAGDAESIILLRPENSRVKETVTSECPLPGQRSEPSFQNTEQNVAAQEVAALLSIHAQREPSARFQNIIVQAPEDSKDVVAAAKRVLNQSDVNALGLRDQRDMTRLIAQSALQPGVASVQCAILQKTPGSVGFYLRTFDNLAGLGFEDVRRRFSGAVICGLLKKKTGLCWLNPCADAILEEGDKIVALAPHGRIFAAKDRWAPEYTNMTSECFGLQKDDWRPKQHKSEAKKVVVAGWCGKVADLTASLTMFAPQGTDVTMVCECAPEGMPTGEIGGINFFHLPGNPHNTNCLEEAGVASADAIIIGPADDLNDAEADAQMLSELMLVQDILIASQRDRSAPAHVVAVVRCPHTVKVANYMVRDLSKGCMTCELLQPDELVSGLIAQVSSEPKLSVLLSQIIDSAQGIQVRLREPNAFQLDDVKAISFAEVSERARALNETALGYITRQGALVLAPPAGSTHVFRNTDRVVVFAGKQEENDGLDWASTPLQLSL